MQSAPEAETSRGRKLKVAVTSGSVLLAAIFKSTAMKYVLLSISIVLIIYPIYGLMKSIQTFGSLSNYGLLVLIGESLILVAGLVTLCFAIKLFIKPNI
jgi:hypothetical protein